MSGRDRKAEAVDRIIRRGELDGGLPADFVVGDFGRDAKRLARGTGSHALNVVARAAMRIGSSRPVNGDPDAPPPAKSRGGRLSGKGKSGNDTSLGSLGDSKKGRSGLKRATRRVLFGKEPGMDLNKKHLRDAGL